VQQLPERGSGAAPRFGARTLRQGRRIGIFLVGWIVVLIGLVLLFLPGPGTPLLIGGFALLALEFAWAKRWLRRGRVTARVYRRSPRRATSSLAP
jgi:tellurite resistance protein TerC